MTREDKAVTSKEEMRFYLVNGKEYGSLSGAVFVTLLRLMDKVFDSFKSRTCSNCRYCNIGSICDGSMECLLGISCIQSDAYNLVEKDFGCNKWKQIL